MKLVTQGAVPSTMTFCGLALEYAFVLLLYFYLVSVVVVIVVFHNIWRKTVRPIVNFLKFCGLQGNVRSSLHNIR